MARPHFSYFINNDVYFRFCFSHSPMVTNKVIIFLYDGLYWEIPARRQGLIIHRKYSIGCTNFLVMIIVQQTAILAIALHV